MQFYEHPILKGQVPPGVAETVILQRNFFNSRTSVLMLPLGYILTGSGENSLNFLKRGMFTQGDFRRYYKESSVPKIYCS